jgi:hypothetical protein
LGRNCRPDRSQDPQLRLLRSHGLPRSKVGKRRARFHRGRIPDERRIADQAGRHGRQERGGQTGRRTRDRSGDPPDGEHHQQPKKSDLADDPRWIAVAQPGCGQDEVAGKGVVVKVPQ